MKRFLLAAILLLGLSTMLVSCVKAPAPFRLSDNFYSYSFFFEKDGTGEMDYQVIGVDDRNAKGEYPINWEYNSGYYEIHTPDFTIGNKTCYGYLYLTKDRLLYFSSTDMREKRTWEAVKIK